MGCVEYKLIIKCFQFNMGYYKCCYWLNVYQLNMQAYLDLDHFHLVKVVHIKYKKYEMHGLIYLIYFKVKLYANERWQFQNVKKHFPKKSLHVCNSRSIKYIICLGCGSQKKKKKNSTIKTSRFPSSAQLVHQLWPANNQLKPAWTSYHLAAISWIFQ